MHHTGLFKPCPPCPIHLAAQSGAAAGKDEGVGIMERTGLQYVRGCEVVEIRDEGERRCCWCLQLAWVWQAAGRVWQAAGAADCGAG